MKLTPGSRWKSAACDVEVVIVKAPNEPGTLACGSMPMLTMAAERPTIVKQPAFDGDGILLGKRYGDPSRNLELLCTRAGQGSLSFEGRPLSVLPTRRLPSSD